MNPFEWSYTMGQWQKANPQLVWYIMGGMGGLLLASSLLGRHRRRPQTTHGSARWASPQEIRAAGLIAPHGVVLGRLGKQLLRDDSETHDLVVAPTRSGKGLGPVLCSLLTWQGSALVFDPADGENADASRAWRQSLGQRVALFTPRRSPQTCINVSDMIRMGKPQEFDDAWTVSDSLLAPDKMVQENSTSRHFRRLATILLTAGQLHLLYTEGSAPLGKVWTLLTQRYATLTGCLNAIWSTVHTRYGRHPTIVGLVNTIRNISGDRELSGVWTTATGPLLPYADPLTQRSTDTSTLNVEDLQYGATPLSLYLVAPSANDLERLAPVYRVISDMVMHRLQDHKPRSATHRLLVVADEAPAYGYSRLLDKGAAEVAKYGIKLLLVAQDIPQLEDTFGRYNSIWGNTQTKVFFAPDSDVTAQRLSENFLGPTTVEQPVLSKQHGLHRQQSVSYQQVGRPLMTADELRAMHPGAAILYRTGMRPILCGKVNCRSDPEYRKRYAMEGRKP